MQTNQSKGSMPVYAEECVSLAECAAQLGVTPQTASRLARENRLGSVQLAGRRVFRQGDIDQYLNSNNLCSAPKDHARRHDSEPAITAISFFSGALGLDLGIEQAGIKAQLLCENDTKCRMTIATNRPEPGLLGDIRKVDARAVYDFARLKPARGIDVMFGGPPCQAFSTAGARRAFNDSRGNVFLKYLSLAEELRPRLLIIENVRGLLSTGYPLEPGGAVVRGGAMALVVRRLEDMGYGISFNLYNAANYGAPQIRERVVIIARRDGRQADWLTPTNSDDPSWGLPAWRTLGEVLDSLKGSPCHASQFPEKRLRYFRMLKEGQYWRNLPETEQAAAMGKAYELSGGKTGFYRRLRRDRPSATLVTSPTMPATDLCHPTEDRPLSIEEYAAIQEFPSEWIFRGSLSDQYRQIGNAVPIALGRAIGTAIFKELGAESADVTLNEGTCPNLEGFPYSRYRRTNQYTWQHD